MPHTAIAWPCFSRGLMSSRMDCESGTSEAPKIPCSNRDATICARLSDNPHSADATVKPPIRLSVRLSNNKHAYYNQGNDRDKDSKTRGNPRLPRCMLARASFV